ncbi:MAG: methyltransferase domain-containing protein [Candidatus Muiribacteriota bacterium]
MKIKDLYDDTALKDKSKKKGKFYDKNKLPEGFKTEIFGCGNPVNYILKKRKNPVIVDLGCGAGIDMFLASKKAYTPIIIGVDFSYEMLKRARHNLQKSKVEAYFIQADLESIPFRKESIDIIISNACIHLTKNKKNIFKKLYNVLKKDGEMYISDIYTKFEWKAPFFKKEFEKTEGIFLYGGLDSENAYFKKLKEAEFSFKKLNQIFFSSANEILPKIKKKYPALQDEIVDELQTNLMIAGDYIAYKGKRKVLPAMAECDCSKYFLPFVSSFSIKSPFVKEMLKDKLNLKKCDNCHTYAEVEDSFMVFIPPRKVFVKFPHNWKKYREMLEGDLGELRKKFELKTFYSSEVFLKNIKKNMGVFQKLINVFARR